MGMQSKYLWMNGEMVEFEKATVHFLTPALHNSSKVLGFRDFPYTVDELVEAVRQTVAMNEFEECYIRPLAYLTDGGWNLTVDAGNLGVGIAVWEWNNYLGEEALEMGIRANITSFTRHHPNVMMTKAKITGNYANSVLAKTESLRFGFEEAIMLDPQGYVAECTGENLFLVRDGVIITPMTAPVLEGITRDTVITLANDLGFEVRETPVSRDQLYIADEVFVCGTAAECIALREIDFRVIGEGRMGPVARAVQKEFQAVIRGRHTRSSEWLDYVKEPALAG
jgi:branched-chain amino acid aminotransferase